MIFVRDLKTRMAEHETIANLIDKDFEVKAIVQNIYTGATMSLFKTEDDNWYIKFSSRDLAYYGKDGKIAKKAFMKMAGTEGELI